MSEKIELNLEALELLAIEASELDYEFDWMTKQVNQFMRATTPSVVLELVRRLRAAEAAVSAKLSNGFNPSGITALHMDCAEVDIEQLRRLFNDHRTVGQQVLILPLESRLEQLDEDAMRAAGWVRAEKLQEAEKDAARFNVLIEGDVEDLTVADDETRYDIRTGLDIGEVVDRCDQALAKRGDS